jgi:hypothetical protein
LPGSDFSLESLDGTDQSTLLQDQLISFFGVFSGAFDIIFPVLNVLFFLRQFLKIKPDLLKFKEHFGPFCQLFCKGLLFILELDL